MSESIFTSLQNPATPRIFSQTSKHSGRLLKKKKKKKAMATIAGYRGTYRCYGDCRTPTWLEVSSRQRFQSLIFPLPFVFSDRYTLASLWICARIRTILDLLNSARIVAQTEKKFTHSILCIFHWLLIWNGLLTRRRDTIEAHKISHLRHVFQQVICYLSDTCP